MLPAIEFCVPLWFCALTLAVSLSTAVHVAMPCVCPSAIPPMPPMSLPRCRHQTGASTTIGIKEGREGEKQTHMRKAMAVPTAQHHHTLNRRRHSVTPTMTTTTATPRVREGRGRTRAARGSTADPQTSAPPAQAASPQSLRAVGGGGVRVKEERERVCVCVSMCVCLSLNSPSHRSLQTICLTRCRKVHTHTHVHTCAKPEVNVRTCCLCFETMSSASS